MKTQAEIIAQIEKTVDAIYNAGTYTSVTQARLRWIKADLELLKTPEPAR